MIGPDGVQPGQPAAPRVSVLVPSFGRPAHLTRCLAALQTQRTPPFEIFVVGRPDDTETRRAAGISDLPVEWLEVEAAGHLPPLVAGVAAANGEVVAVTDDDCAPWPNWLWALLRHYADPTVVGVGGLVSQPGPYERVVSKHIGRIGPTGRLDRTNSARIPATWGAREVDVLPGGNMSYRTTLLRGYRWDARMNVGAATDYEVDLAAFARRHGRLIWDPDAAVTHNLAPRHSIGRARSPEEIAAYSHNVVYIAGKALPPLQATLAVCGSFLVGNRFSYGLATAVGDTLLGRPPSLRGQLLPALRGKLGGLRSLERYARSGPETIEPVTKRDTA